MGQTPRRGNKHFFGRPCRFRILSRVVLVQTHSRKEMQMRTNLIAMALLAAAVAAPAADVKSNDSMDATAAFSRLKSLVGEWEADSPMGKMQTSFELIAGGTALVEHERHEKMPEMLTIYHMDGKRLMLTHYCMAGNQPRMEARAYDPAAGRLEFRFLDITNLAGPAAGYMRNAHIRFIDNKHLSAAWEYLQDGKTETHDLQYTRVK
jgi:hypothetical protein